MEAAVVCSGRNRPQASKGQWLAMPRLRRGLYIVSGDLVVRMHSLAVRWRRVVECA